MMRTPEEHVRQDVEFILRFGLRDRTWDYLLAKGFVERCLKGEECTEALADEARQLLEASGGYTSEQTDPAMLEKDVGRTPMLEARRDAISVLLAREAEKEKQVKSFRDKFLEGRLIPWEKVEEWIKGHVETDPPSTLWLRVPVPPGHSMKTVKGHPVPDPPVSISEENPAWGVSTDLLAYALPGDRWPRRLPVAQEGVLGYLRSVSVSLSRTFGWHEAQATVFVLTNVTPQYVPLQVEAALSGPFTVTSRVKLTVDFSVSPGEIAEVFRRTRAKLLSSRPRGLKEKHLHLAVFIAERAEGETWRQKMIAWNAAWRDRQPDWLYERETNFARDCNQAKQRLLRPDIG